MSALLLVDLDDRVLAVSHNLELSAEGTIANFAVTSAGTAVAVYDEDGSTICELPTPISLHSRATVSIAIVEAHWRQKGYLLEEEYLPF